MGMLVVGSAALFIAVTVVLVVARGAHPDLTISLHVAQTRATAVVFGVATVVTAGMLALYVWGYLPAHAKLSPVFYVLAFVQIVTLALVGIFPHLPRTKIIHQPAARVLMITVALTALDLAVETATRVPWPVTTFDLAFVAYAVANVVIFSTRRAWMEAHMLFFEASYMAFYLVDASLYAMI
jgi:hypothetical protein